MLFSLITLVTPEVPERAVEVCHEHIVHYGYFHCQTLPLGNYKIMLILHGTEINPYHQISLKVVELRLKQKIAHSGKGKSALISVQFLYIPIVFPPPKMKINKNKVKSFLEMRREGIERKFLNRVEIGATLFPTHSNIRMRKLWLPLQFVFIPMRGFLYKKS